MKELFLVAIVKAKAVNLMEAHLLFAQNVMV
jgi:hypothetical protein